MAYLTTTFQEAQDLFRTVAGLHDATVHDIVMENEKTCRIEFEDVYEHSIERGFQVKYRRLTLFLRGVYSPIPLSCATFKGYDVIESELDPSSLWIRTLVGGIEFHFDSLQFSEE